MIPTQTQVNQILTPEEEAAYIASRQCNLCHQWFNNKTPKPLWPDLRDLIWTPDGQKIQGVSNLPSEGWNQIGKAAICTSCLEIMKGLK